MRDQDYSASSGFLKRLFAGTRHRVELRACPNARGQGGAASIFTRNAGEIEEFARRKDLAGLGTYFGACTRREGAASGNLASVMECPALWVDIDCAAQGIDTQAALAALQWLPFPPSIVVHSGGGLHGYWMLEAPLDVAEGSQVREPAVAALRALAGVLAGDMKCAELARILRLPGTHNSKERTLALNHGAPARCHVIEDTGRVHDFTALVEWLATQRAVLHGKPPPPAEPFAAHARASGFAPAVDVEAALAAMAHEAPGDASIHQTQLRVSASLLARGMEEDAIVERVLRATEAAAPAGAQWNWAAEERAIRAMVQSARAKGFAGAGRGATVDDLKEERAKRESRSPRDGKSATVAVGKAVIGAWSERYGPVMHTGGATYAYEGGIWLVWDEALAQRLRAIVQEACAALGLEPRTSLLAAARAYFMDRPELYRDDVAFDAHGLLVAEDGALDLASLEVREHAPEHHARFKVAACLKGPRDCPAWLGFLDNVFADRTCADEIVATLQEWFGASIAVTRARPLLKGLLAHGASRTGKTQVSEVMRGLLGERHVCNARMRDLEGRFGLEPLIGKRGWIADDAIGVKEYLDAETYKVVVTGERTSAQTKGGKNVEVRFGFPVLLTANNLPRVNDKSDATYNRSLILPMTRVRPEDAPEPAGYDSIARKVIAEELTGVLWWAIEGRARLFARGRYAPPAAMLEAGRSFQDSNDPVGSWMRQCIEPCTRTKVARKDLASSFNGWWQLESDDGKRFSANAITREIKARFPSIAEIKTQGERFFGGIRLNEDGLFAWETRTKGYDSGGKAYSAAPEEVNRHWEQAVLLKGGGHV